jgi:hypothetical protein
MTHTDEDIKRLVWAARRAARTLKSEYDWWEEENPDHPGTPDRPID